MTNYLPSYITSVDIFSTDGLNNVWMGSFIYKTIAINGISIFYMVIMFDTQKYRFPSFRLLQRSRLSKTLQTTLPISFVSVLNLVTAMVSSLYRRVWLISYQRL
jgi:hypothetical protein